MKVILDTNVVISAVYFGGAPLKILRAWRDGLLELVVTDDILRQLQNPASADARDARPYRIGRNW